MKQINLFNYTFDKNKPQSLKKERLFYLQTKLDHVRSGKGTVKTLSAQEAY